jgi:hypothetical protein
MKINLLKFLLLTAVFLPSFVQEIFACSCYGTPTPYKAYKEAKAVFVGKVVGFKEKIDGKLSKSFDNERYKDRTDKYYRFVVLESFKGAKESELDVYYRPSNCEFGFDIGEIVLVYAYEWEDSEGILNTSRFCSRTGALETAQDDIHFLRALLQNKPEPRIYGSVQILGEDSVTNSNQYSYVEGIKIVAESKKRRFETITDRNGIYSFNKIPNGEYKVYPKLPTKYTVLSLDLYNVTLQSKDEFGYQDYGKFKGRSVYSKLLIGWNNEISGNVLDSEGKYLERATVRLLHTNQVNDKPLAVDRNNAEILAKESPESNARKYTMSSRAPGKYVLALEVFAPFTSGTQNLRMYYPQATNLEKAEIINLGEFDKRNINLKLPDGFIVRELEGTLVWSNGLPVKEGYILIEKLENTEDKNNITYDMQRVKDGKFKIQAFENAEYWMHAEVYDLKFKPIKIRVGKFNAPIKIMVTQLKSVSATEQ